MAAGQHNPSRRALLGAVVALPLLPRHCEEPFDSACGGAQDKLPLRGSDEAIQCGARGSAGLLRSARNDGKWQRVLAGLTAAEAEMRAIERLTAGGTAEEEEAFEEVYLSRVEDFLAAVRRVMRVRAPDLQALALKIELAIDEEVGTITGGELRLAALRRDVRRLMA